MTPEQLQLATRPLRAWQPAVSARYPHMAPADAIVWREWIRNHLDTIKAVYYDVHVGSLPHIDPDSEDVIFQIAGGISVKRIDVVVNWGDQIWVVELKPFGNAAAMGQAILYATLFHEAFSDTTPISPVIICNEADRDVRAIAPNFGIQVIETLVEPEPEKPPE